MCEDNSTIPDFYLIKTEPVDAARVHRCWVRRSVKYAGKKLFVVSVQPHFTNERPHGSKPDCVLMTPRCTRLRVLPQRKKSVMYSLMRLCHWPSSVYVLRYRGESEAIGPELQGKEVEIICWGEIHPTAERAEKSLRWWANT